MKFYALRYESGWWCVDLVSASRILELFRSMDFSESARLLRELRA